MKEYNQIKNLKMAEENLAKEKAKEVALAKKAVSSLETELRNANKSLMSAEAQKSKKEARIDELHAENSTKSRKAVKVMERNFEKFLVDYNNRKALVSELEQKIAQAEEQVETVIHQEKIEVMAFQLNWVQFGGKAKAQEIYLKKAREISQSKMEKIQPLTSDERSPWAARKAYRGSVK